MTRGTNRQESDNDNRVGGVLAMMDEFFGAGPLEGGTLAPEWRAVADH